MEELNIYEKNIKNFFQNEKLIEKIDSFKDSNVIHNIENVQIKVSQSVETFYFIKEVLIKAINNRFFKQLSIHHQKKLSERVNDLHNRITGIINHNFTLSIQLLLNEIIVTGLDIKVINLKDTPQNLFTKINELEEAYNKSIKTIENLDDNLKSINALVEKINEQSTIVSKARKKSTEYYENIETLAKKVREFEQEVQNSKLSIVAFKENIDKYKETIDSQTNKSEEIVQKYKRSEEDISNLIEKAREALNLNESVGISAALSEQYKDENKPIKKRPWIISATLFVVLAVGGIIWLASGSISDSITIGKVISRITLISITIGAATFSARQYIRQKNIIDTYAHKMVLAKSIVGFAEKVAEHDSDSVSSYLQKTLEEINQSPVNQGQKQEGFSKKQIEVLTKLVETIVSNLGSKS